MLVQMYVCVCVWCMVVALCMYATTIVIADVNITLSN